MKKKLFTLLFALATSISTMFAASGTCGKNLTWDLTDGVLTISGTGEMTNWSGWYSQAPWHSYQITSVIIRDSVTSIGDKAFDDCSGLTSVTIGNSVTNIGDDAFRYCNGLTSVHISDLAAWCAITFSWYNSNPLYYAHHLYLNDTEITDLVIPNNVTSIGYGAFYECSGLTSVTIPNSVTSIGKYAFCGCSGLTSVTIPNSITSIGYGAFYECSGLKSVTIPNGVTSIGKYAFHGCYGLTSVIVENGNTVYDSRDNCNAIIETSTNTLIVGCKNTIIPNSVTSIGNYAFYNCFDLTSVTIPNSVTSIGYQAFYGCSGLMSVTIGNSVTSIGDYAFWGCSGLTSVTIPNSVTNIGSYAFYNCSSLTSVTIPNSVTSIGEKAFYLVPNISYSGTATGSPWEARSVNGYVEDYFVYSDDTKTNLLACSAAATGEISIPNSVTSIGEYAFYDCSGLTSVTIPDSVASIGMDAFYNCSGLTSVTIPNSVTSIGEKAFYECSGLTSVTLNSNAIVSGFHIKGIFGTQVQKYVIGDDVTSIGYQAFYGCSGLMSVTIGNSVTSIGRETFYECSGLTSVTIGNSVTSIGYAAFDKCSGLTSIEIPNSVTSIEKYAFWGCSGLTSVTIGNSVTSIGEEAFYGCSYIDTVVWNATHCEDMEYSPFYSSCNHIKAFIIANDIVRIPANLCWGVKSIRELTIPSSVNYIGKDAFYGTNITEIEIPSTVTSVGGRSFAYCPLQKVHWNVANQTDYEVVEDNNCITVSLDASNLDWNNAYIYAWTNSGSTITSAWPGTAVQKDENGRYTYSFSSTYSSVNIIWNNGTDQTVDIKDVEASTIYALNSSSGTSISYTTRPLDGRLVCPFYRSTDNITEFTFGKDVTRVPAQLCRDMKKLEDVNLPIGVTEIGRAAFKNCTKLESLSLNENINHYGDEVFSNCPALTSIYNYRERPAKLGENAFNGVDYFGCTLYVLANSLNMYKASASDWKDFYYIEPIVGTETTITANSVTVEAGDHTALFTWPVDDNAASYSLQITKDGVIFCTLSFDADGSLKGIAFAPGKDGYAHAPAATLTTNGMQFTVTGLNSASKYSYRLAVTDASDNLLVAYSGEFATNGYEGEVIPGGEPESDSEAIDLISEDSHSNGNKLLRDGQVLIQRGDKTYTITGQVVK